MVLRWLIWQLLVAVVVAMQEPPPNALNVVLVLADAWRYSAFGGADEPDALALTPRLDAFRKNSVDFQRAYAAYPFCTPSRISIQCGLLVTSHNVTKNGAPLSTSTPTLASTFSALGWGSFCTHEANILGCLCRISELRPCVFVPFGLSVS